MKVYSLIILFHSNPLILQSRSWLSHIKMSGKRKKTFIFQTAISLSDFLGSWKPPSKLSQRVKIELCRKLLEKNLNVQFLPTLFPQAGSKFFVQFFSEMEISKIIWTCPNLSKCQEIYYSRKWKFNIRMSAREKRGESLNFSIALLKKQ